MAELMNNLSSTFISIIDILLVATLIYYLLYLLKGTRSARIAFGIVMLILLYFIADRFQLQTMAWLLQNFLTYIVIAIIVIFQADIRKALATFGRNPFLDFFRIGEKGAGYLVELQRAVNFLAQRNIGALIVIERELELKNLIETGIQIDAQIKSDLLVSIFNTRSPLHDGAVILSGGRIASAGAILPLSARADIVVSEEQGSVSLAFDGKLVKFDTPLELEKRLKQLFNV